MQARHHSACRLSFRPATRTGTPTRMGDQDRQGRGLRQESWLSNATATTAYSEDDSDERDRPSILSEKFWTTPRATHALAVALLGSLAGGLALPQEIPVIRSFACEWYFKHHPMYILGDQDRCQSPIIAKLAGEIITSARILNALISEPTTSHILKSRLSDIQSKPSYA